MASKECIFCLGNQLITPDIIVENELGFAMWDQFPLVPGHALLIPRVHVDNFFDVSTEELDALHALSLEVKTIIDQRRNPDGYNIFTNVGNAAGQVVMHAHMHVVPRFEADATVVMLGDHTNPDRAH